MHIYLKNRYHPLISQALNCYVTDQVMEADLELAGQFADEMLTMIESKKEDFI